MPWHVCIGKFTPFPVRFIWIEDEAKRRCSMVIDKKCPFHGHSYRFYHIYNGTVCSLQMHFDCESDARHPFPKSICNRSFWSKSMKNTRTRVHRMQSGHTSFGTCGYTQPNRQPNRTLRFFLSCDDRQANMQIAMNTQFKRMFGGNGRKRFALRFSSADKNRIAWDCRLTRQLIYLQYVANAFKYTGRTFVSCDIGTELEGCGGEIGPAKIWDARGIISINGRPLQKKKHIDESLA